MRQCLVIAERHPDPAGIGRCRRGEAGFEIAVAAAEQHEPAAEIDQTRQGGQQQIEPLLRGQPGDRAKERRSRVAGEAKAPLERFFRRRLSGWCIVDRVASRQCRVVFRRPDLGVDAVQNAGQHVGAGAQQAVETPAESRGLDLACIGRADRRQPVGVEQPSLEERQASVELHPVNRKKARR